MKKLLSDINNALLAPGPERGTWQHFWGGIGLGVLMGLAFYLARQLGT